ncbi:hypothetical protein ACUOFU_15760 [Microbacterium arabinogalactanolyticum]|uniref:hypothetical protein n=1 Tax=Microbacterium arabinogalactanolyticum TaxID=69365 RepID=UPI0040445389
MSEPTPGYLPEDPDLDDDAEPGTRVVDGEEVLDPDADPDLIDSAEADRLATGGDDAADAGDVPAGGAGADSGAVDAVQVDPEDEAEIPDISETNDEPGVGTRRPD